MNKIIVVLTSIPKYRSKSSLNLFLGLLVEQQNLHKFADFFLGAPQRLGVNQSNMTTIINSTSRIKIYTPLHILIDRAQLQKHVKVQVNDLKIATFV